MHPHTFAYASGATVHGWADPITGYVWETVYDGSPDVGTMVTVHTEQQVGWATHREPNYFAGSFALRGPAPVCLPLISTRGTRCWNRDFFAEHVGDLALTDYGPDGE